jgi:hypothetical protein
MVVRLTKYRISFVDCDGRVFDAVQFERATDEEAVAEAHRLHIPSVGAGFDVWRKGRLLNRYRPLSN